ncbi:MAG: hypothetical protein ACHQNA_15055, partial [Acidimicrobiales bacterium]
MSDRPDDQRPTNEPAYPGADPRSDAPTAPTPPAPSFQPPYFQADPTPAPQPQPQTGWQGPPTWGSAAQG